MRQSAKSLIILLVATAAVAILVWTIVHDTSSEQYVLQRRDLTGWTAIAGQGAEPWVLAAQPPATLVANLFKQLSANTGLTLVAPTQLALPLVLRAEYDDALQGVYGIDALRRAAEDVAIERAVFEPICVAQRTDPTGPRQRQLYYIAFNSPVFGQLRQELLPAQPEHGGVGVYDPAALLPLLPVAASDDDFGRWWPLAFDRRTDCVAPLFVQ
jgi:hypothetical protein